MRQRQRFLDSLSRPFLRLNLALYRCVVPGYERIFGKHWMVVTTKGRRSGKPHRVLLDVVGHDPVTNRYYIQPGEGRRCDWVRNIEADPVVEVQIGRRQFRARVVDVSGPEGAHWLVAFAKRHPLQTMFVTWLMPDLKPPVGSDEEIKAWCATHLIMFGLDPFNDRNQ
jgi:deazaflavin-dependent oxidoreductase (nitroreductase family)